MSFVFAAGLMLLALCVFDSDIVWGRWAVLCAACVVFLSYKIYKKIDLPSALFVGYVLLNSLYVVGVQFYDDSMPTHPRHYLGALGSYSGLALLLVGGAVYYLGSVKRRSLLYGFELFCMANAALFLLGHSLIGNGSNTASFLAVIYPLSIKRSEKWMFPARMLYLMIIPIAIFYSQSAIGIACLVAVSAVMFAAYTKRYLLTILLTVSGLVMINYSLGDAYDLSSHGLRFQFWQEFMGWWWRDDSLWFGTGNGSSRFYLPIIQNAKHLPAYSGYWAHMHSDWLQSLFELGIVGLVASLWLAMTAAVRALRARRFELFGCVIGYCIIASGNYPSELAIGCVLALALYLSCWDLTVKED